MQPLRCQGGYAVPIRVGKVEIMGIHAPASALATASRLRVVDNGSYAILPDTQATDKVIAEMQRVISIEGNVTLMFPEPIKCLEGVNVTYATNLTPGSICVFVR